MEEFYKMVADKATINVEKNGDPMLSTTEMLEIVTDLALKDISEEINIKKFIEHQKEIEKVFVNFKEGYPTFLS